LFLNNYFAFSQWHFQACTDPAGRHREQRIATAPAEPTIPVHAVKNDSQFLWVSL
jgi:hypothetical protein